MSMIPRYLFGTSSLWLWIWCLDCRLLFRSACSFPFVTPTPRPGGTLSTQTKRSSLTHTFLQSTAIEYQSDESMYGRGERHLTAVLDENDVVVYQTGTWLVDGVSVGEGRAGFAYAQVETIQLVWTHNCEHGVVRGLALELVHDKDNADSPPIFVRHQFDQIEFGPEQLLAKIPVEWINDSQGETKASCRALVPVNDQHWQDFLV